MSRKKVILFLLSVLVFLMCSAESCDQQCTTCVADPFAKQDSSGNWVAKPTASPAEKAVKNAVQTVDNVDKNMTKAVYGSANSVPAGKTLIDKIGAGRTVKELDEFNARCARFGGTVASADLWTIGCYK